VLIDAVVARRVIIYDVMRSVELEREVEA